MSELGWLIEKDGPLWIFCNGWGGFDWTSDSLKAIRFARRQDAEQVMQMIESADCKATQHKWINRDEI